VLQYRPTPQLCAAVFQLYGRSSIRRCISVTKPLFFLGTIRQFFQIGKHTDLDRLRPRRVFRRLKFERHVELLPLHSSESPRLEQANPSFNMSDGFSLTAKGVKEGRLSVSALLIARCLLVGDYRQVTQPGG